MRKTDAAEAILSLTTSRDHAASIAGDLVQQAPLKGTIWFWGSLVGTTASLTWKAFTEAPLRITGLGLVGLLVQIFYMILIEVPLVLLRLGLAMKRLTVAREPTAGFETTVNSPAWEYTLVFLFVSFLIGRWVARRAPGKELVVYATIWVTAHILWIPVLNLIPSAGQTLPTLRDLGLDVIATAIGGLAALVGVRSMRRRLPAA